MKRKRLGKRQGKSAARSPDHKSDGRDQTTGRFLLKNSAAVKHGLYRFKRKHALPPDLQPQIDAFANQLLSDQGGEDQCSALRLGLVRRITEVEAICRLLAHDLAEKGPITPKGRMRNAATMFLSAVDRFNKLAGQLGLERKQKPVGTIEDYIKQKEQAP